VTTASLEDAMAIPSPYQLALFEVYCSGCDSWQPRAHFYPDPRRRDDVLRPCKACIVARHKRQREEKRAHRPLRGQDFRPTVPLDATQAQCHRCHAVKERSAFQPSALRKDGTVGLCKACASADKKAYYRRNKQAICAHVRQYAATHRVVVLARKRTYFVRHYERFVAYRAARREIARAYARDYYWDHREERAAYTKAYNAANRERLSRQKLLYTRTYPEKARQWVATRRARVAGAVGSYTAAEWQALCAAYDYRCLCCGAANVPLTRDHVIPLTKGGRNDIANIQPLCRSCNSAKHDKIIDYRPSGIVKIL
jgi:5-methylcytosine-specific restriction endonuclease McrA